MKVSIIGLGFVGCAMYKSFQLKNDELNEPYEIYGYDKYKNGGIGSLESCLNSEIIFLALPTEYNESTKEYDKTPIYSVLDELESNKYNKCIIVKSTVEPTTTDLLQEKYPDMNFIHNPEFLTARTAFEDCHNQTHIVLGKTNQCDPDLYKSTIIFYKKIYQEAEISKCSSIESESMKIFCNSFYAIKVQFFNELYLLSQKLNADYDIIIQLMLKNNWINPMHTNVPGPDGKLSYGGLCFPKDTNALLQIMKKHYSEHKILESCIEERNEMREDHDNIQKSIIDISNKISQPKYKSK